MKNSLSISQNFIKSKSLVYKLLKKSNLSKNEIIIDIGAGDGSISKVLLELDYKVLAFELDKNLYQSLKAEITNNNFKFVQEDFLKYDFKKSSNSYNIFANIPFNQTTEMVQKILIKEKCFKEVYLIMQEEAANRFIGKKEGLLQSLLILNNYIPEITYKFNKTDFNPVPKVNIVLIKFIRRDAPLIDQKFYPYFLDFISYIIMQQKPSIIDRLSKVLNYYALKDYLFELKIDPYKTLYEIPKAKYFEAFNLFLKKFPKEYAIFKNSYSKYLQINKGNKKVYQTRIK